MELITGDNSFFEKGFSPSVIRFFFLQAHYRSVVDLSNNALLASEKGFNRLMEAVKIINDFETENTEVNSQFQVEEFKANCYNALTDDFNSPILIAHLFDATNFIFKLKEGNEMISKKDLMELKTLINTLVFDVLGLKNISENNHSKLDSALQVLIDLRNQARKVKNFELSDQIRDRLLEQGIELKDGREGTTYKII